MRDEGQIQARVVAEAESGGFLDGLAERVGLATRATAVFAEPVEREGVTVIPVAKARWAFGGGTGRNAEGGGSGGGGGGVVSPYGYIELRSGGAEFRRTRDVRPAAALAAAGIAVAAFLAGRR